MAIRQLAKFAAQGACQQLGINRWCRNRMREHLTVLCYHGVVRDHQADRFGYGNTVSQQEFQQQLEYLARHFQPVSASDVIASRQQGRPLPERAALITFDDGYRNNCEQASGILLRVGVPCVFHVSTGYIGQRRILWVDEVVQRILAWPEAEIALPEGGTGPLPAGQPRRRRLAVQLKDRCKRLPAEQAEAYLALLRQRTADPVLQEELHAFMNWDEVRKLQAQGFDIGSHTVSHPILTRISTARLAQELAASKRLIEAETGVPCTCIAYPNGGAHDVSRQVFEAAGAAGYQLGFTVAERHSEPGEDPLAISRLCIQGHVPLSAFSYRVDGVQRMAERQSG
jgi:peptidoglycan/xylan/chitin deacetylase (PgdA/CDA1 family)